MNKKLSKITRDLNLEKLRNDKRVVVFSVCLLIATSLWFLNALSKNYSTTLSYPVKYINPPQGQFLGKEPPTEIELKVNAHGFALLRNKLDFSFSPIIINLTEITKNSEPTPNGFRISTNKLLRRISAQVSSEITINSVLPEIIYIKLDSLKTKLVPVKADINFSFKPQYHLKDSVSISPEKINITGPGTIIDTISFLTTENKTFEKLDASFKAILKIVNPEKTTVDTKFINLKIPVEKFTEKELKIPIQIANKPDNIIIKLFPSEIKLTVLVGLSEFENIDTSKFEVFVDYKTIEQDTKNLQININSKIENIKIIRHSPVNIEYLIETK
jgi:hypothetical protein